MPLIRATLAAALLWLRRTKYSSQILEQRRRWRSMLPSDCHGTMIVHSQRYIVLVFQGTAPKKQHDSYTTLSILYFCWLVRFISVQSESHVCLPDKNHTSCDSSLTSTNLILKSNATAASLLSTRLGKTQEVYHLNLYQLLPTIGLDQPSLASLHSFSMDTRQCLACQEGSSSSDIGGDLQPVRAVFFVRGLRRDLPFSGGGKVFMLPSSSYIAGLYLSSLSLCITGLFL